MAGEIDADLLYDPKQSPAVQTEPVVEETLWVIGLPSAKLKRNRPVPLASLAGTPLICRARSTASACSSTMPAPWPASS